MELQNIAMAVCSIFHSATFGKTGGVRTRSPKRVEKSRRAGIFRCGTELRSWGGNPRPYLGRNVQDWDGLESWEAVCGWPGMEFCLLHRVGIPCVVVYVSTVVVHGTMAIVAKRLFFFCGVVLFSPSL